MDPIPATNAPDLADRVARLERLLESTMQQVGFLTGVLRDLVDDEPQEPPPGPGVIIPIRR